MRWARVGRSVSAEGSTTTYQGVGSNLTIESRKRHIPHANGIGTWDYTSYFVLKDGKEIKELHSLRDAKEYADKMED